MAMTTRAARLVEAAAEIAARRGHDYVGTEHLLEAILDDDGGVASGILAAVGAREAIRQRLDDYWEQPSYGSLLVADADGTPYQVATVGDSPGAPQRLLRGAEGQVLVWTPVADPAPVAGPPGPRSATAPAAVAQQAEQWEASVRD